MDLMELEVLKQKMTREAAKWVDYLGTIASPEERTKELTRKFIETWLEGHMENRR